MKAIVNTQYGPPEVLQLKEVEKPIPKDNEILIKVKATAVNSGDWRMRKADPFGVRLFFGLTKPKRHILGGVLSGEIENIGKDVKLFKVGDQVFGSTDMNFGTAAIQLAKYFGAIVTGVCSTANIDLVKSLGADKVIDYTKEDFTNNGETYDVIFDTVNKISFSCSLNSLNKNGILILSAAGMSEMFKGLWTSMKGNKKVLTGIISQNAADINFLKGLIETGRMKAVIDKTYLLAQTAVAHAYVEKGHKRGNVSITVAE